MRCHLVRAGLILVIVIMAWSTRAVAQGPPPQASVNNRFEWDQTAPSVNEATAYIYKYYLDNATTGQQISGVSCVGTGTPFLCSVSVPSMSNGNHTISFTASNIAGESPKSTPFGFSFVVIPAAPSGIRIR